MAKNPNRDIYRAGWTRAAREQAGYPEETKAQTIARLTEASKDEYVGAAAQQELARLTKKGAKKRG